LLHRYGGNLEYILNLEIDEAIELIIEASNNTYDEQLYSRWLMDYLMMDNSNFVSFENYKKLLFNSKSVSKKNSLEIAEKIKAKDQGKGV
jgi:hypothetical protein